MDSFDYWNAALANAERLKPPVPFATRAERRENSGFESRKFERKRHAISKRKSGNPGGRPKVVGEVQALARECSAEAINTLRETMRDKKAPPAARVAAANSLLDRGVGSTVAIRARKSSGGGQLRRCFILRGGQCADGWAAHSS